MREHSRAFPGGDVPACSSSVTPRPTRAPTHTHSDFIKPFHARILCMYFFFFLFGKLQSAVFFTHKWNFGRSGQDQSLDQ
uniref:Uncharacterized protein n=1 Tax=Catharus ustulatus TaxID=91951 RepID=A0A8C3U1M9_CATUS